jgi:hypothetical protein
MFDYEAILHKYSATCRSPDDEMENVHYLRSKLELKKIAIEYNVDQY